MNMLMNESTISLYQPVWSRMSILILGMMPRGKSISMIIPKVFSVNQNVAFAAIWS